MLVARLVLVPMISVLFVEDIYFSLENISTLTKRITSRDNEVGKN